MITIRIKGELGHGKTAFSIANSSGALTIANLADNLDGTHSATVMWQTQYSNELGELLDVANDSLIVRVMPPTVVAVPSSIDWIMVERGNMASDWSPAPEDGHAEIQEVKEALLELTDEKIVSMVTSSQSFSDAVGNQIDNTQE